MLDLSVTVEPRQVLRALGYPRGRGPAREVAARLDEIGRVAATLVRPRGAFAVVSGEEAAAMGMPRPGTLVGLGLCTIGPELEAESHRRTHEGRVLDAMLLDACGSAAAEAATDALDARLCAHVLRSGLRPAARISPGYGRWDVRHQRELLARLPAPALGVHLTEGMMMVPRKSVSFAARLSPGATARRPGRRRCDRCGLVGCAHRITNEDRRRERQP